MSGLRYDLQAVADLIPASSKVLEVGCAEGDLLAHLTAEKQVNGRGIELSQQSVRMCVQKGLAVIQGNIDNDLIHYPDNSFDYVISNYVLQATYRPKDVLEQMLRIGKSVVVTTPNFAHWRNRLYLACKGRMPVTRTLRYEWYETPNIHFSTLKDFEMLYRELGCECRKRVLFDVNGKSMDGLLGSCFANFYSDRIIFSLS